MQSEKFENLNNNFITFDQVEPKPLSISKKHPDPELSLRNKQSKEVCVTHSSYLSQNPGCKDPEYLEFSNKFSEISPIRSSQRDKNTSLAVDSLQSHSLSLSIEERDKRIEKNYKLLEKSDQNSILLISNFDSCSDSIFDSLPNNNISAQSVRHKNMNFGKGKKGRKRRNLVSNIATLDLENEGESGGVEGGRIQSNRSVEVSLRGSIDATNWIEGTEEELRDNHNIMILENVSLEQNIDNFLFKTPNLTLQRPEKLPNANLVKENKIEFQRRKH